LLVNLSKNVALRDLMTVLKGESSKWIKTRGPSFSEFYWHDGHGAFSIGESQVSAVTEYIATQNERHRTRTFEEEFVALLDRYGVSYDAKYLWT